MANGHVTIDSQPRFELVERTANGMSRFIEDSQSHFELGKNVSVKDSPVEYRSLMSIVSLGNYSFGDFTGPYNELGRNLLKMVDQIRHIYLKELELKNVQLSGKLDFFS